MSLAAALLVTLALGRPAWAQSDPLADDDGDGVANGVDACQPSDLAATVIIDTCDSGVTNQLFSTGCTIADLVAACAVAPKNHGQYISCVSRVLNGLKKNHVITGREKGAIQRCAAGSDIGKPVKP
jgi:hypothetical protein